VRPRSALPLAAASLRSLPSKCWFYRLSNVLRHRSASRSALTPSTRRLYDFSLSQEIYQNYNVLYANWVIEASAQNNSHKSVVGWAIRRSVTPLTATDYVETGSSVVKLMGSDDAGTDVISLSGAVNIARGLGLKDSNREALEPAMSASPTEVLYLHVFTQDQDTTNQGPGVVFSIRADLTTRFREKKKLDIST